MITEAVDNTMPSSSAAAALSNVCARSRLRSRAASSRRAALVLWPAERRGAVLAAAGPEVALPCLEDLARRTAADAALRDEALSLAREMLSAWPKFHWRLGRGDGPSEAGRMAAVLRDLDDAALIARALGALFAAGWYVAADVGPVLDALNRLASARRGRLLARIATDGAERHPGVCVAPLSGAPRKAARSATSCRGHIGLPSAFVSGSGALRPRTIMCGMLSGPPTVA